MTRTEQLRAEFVEYIPERLNHGVLYVSRRYSTASHLCCCGCGLEVVTPLNPAKWRLSVDGGAASLSPSVGNWSFPCKSHYWITKNRVRWALPMSPEIIAAVQAHDRRDAELLAVSRSTGRFSTLIDRVRETWIGFVRSLRHWWQS
jgi:hypothetical protein